MTDTATLTGRVLNQKYQITSHLRPARMGDFWLARRLTDQTLVQVKMLDPALFNEPEALARFEREAQVVGAVEHPCVMRLIDHGRTPEGMPYLVTEHVAGDLLSEVIEETERLPPERAARIAARVALALAAAHDRGIIHRDLSPSNILVCEVAGDPDAVKVLEFGLARITDSETGGDEASVTAVGVRIGSPTYMAPEYIEEYSLDFRADLYGLGIVLYEMLVGQPPFTGRPYKVLNLHVNEPAPAPSKSQPDVPAWLDTLVLKLLEKQPGNRPKSGRAVVEALEKGVGAKLDPPAPKVMAPPPPTVPVTAIPSRDPIIDNFIARQIKKVERRKNVPVPDRSKCFVVDEVARWSLCGDIGVKPLWLCELPDEPRPGLRTPEFWREFADTRRYVFTAPDGSEQVELTATGIEPGASFVRSVEMIRARFDPGEPEALALYELWRQAAWEELEKQCRRLVSGKSAMTSGLFSRLLGSAPDRKKVGMHPGLLFLGAALVESGKEKEGFEMVNEWATTQGHQWPARYQAVAAFYGGMRALKAGRETSAVEQWNAGLEMESLPRMVEAIEKLLGERRNPTPWLAQKFPDYGIDLPGNQGEIRLSRSLDLLDGSQVVAICMLGGFRGNLEYDEFIARFIAASLYFDQFLAEVHVISTQRERESDRPEFYRSEDQARKAGIRLVVLHDALAWVQRSVKITRIPTVFLVNRWGYVAHEGRMEPPALWEALRRTAMMRLRNMSQER
jgi:serine/threonine-protein kinase